MTTETVADPFADLPPIFRACAAKEIFRYAINVPFRIGNYIYATDGRTAVRMKAPTGFRQPKGEFPPVDTVGWNEPRGEPVDLPDPGPAPERGPKCERCKGKGVGPVDCEQCRGTGECECYACGHTTDCGECDGDGKVLKKGEKCPDCGGEGYRPADDAESEADGLLITDKWRIARRFARRFQGYQIRLPESPDKPVLVVGDGWEALVMPTKAGAQ